MQVAIDLGKLLGDLVGLEIKEFVLYVSHLKEVYKEVAESEERVSIWGVGVLVGEGGLGEGQGLVQVHLVFNFVHNFIIITIIISE